MQKTLIVEGVSEIIHARFKSACAYHGESMKEVILRAMKDYIKDFEADKQRRRR